MRTLYYLQLGIIIFIILYLFTSNTQLLFLILFAVIAQTLILMRFHALIAFGYILFQLGFLGLMNLPYVWFVFAALYLLVSLFIAVLFNKTTIIFSNYYHFKSVHDLFKPTYTNTKKKSTSSHSNSGSSKYASTSKKESSQNIKTGVIKDVDFEEK